MEIGSVFRGRYRIEQRIGRGASSEVYRATHIDLGQRVVLKLTDERSERLVREGRALAKLKNRHTVRVLDFGRDLDRAFLVLEWIDGESVATRLDRDGAFDWLRTLTIVHDVLDSLEEAHRVGVDHGELTPARVMLDVDDQVKVVEFGAFDPATGRRAAANDLHDVAHLVDTMTDSPPLPAVGGWLARLRAGRTDAAALRRELGNLVEALARAQLVVGSSAVDRVGEEIGSRYRVGRLLEQRTRQQRYRATHHDTREEVTLVLLTDAPRDPAWGSAFREGVRALADLRHPNLVRILDYGYTDDGTPFYVEEAPRGGSLFRRLQDGPMAPREIVELLRDAAEGLTYAHRAGVLHLGLVPSAITLPIRPTGVTAKVGELVPALLASLDPSWDGVVEPRVTAPEVWRGAAPSPAADVYGLGHIAASAIRSRRSRRSSPRTAASRRSSPRSSTR